MPHSRVRQFLHILATSIGFLLLWSCGEEIPIEKYQVEGSRLAPAEFKVDSCAADSLVDSAYAAQRITCEVSWKMDTSHFLHGNPLVTGVSPSWGYLDSLDGFSSWNEVILDTIRQTKGSDHIHFSSCTYSCLTNRSCSHPCLATHNSLLKLKAPVGLDYRGRVYLDLATSNVLIEGAAP